MSDRPELAPEQVTYYRQILRIHTNDPELGACKVCNKPRCRDWLDAFDKLAEAHQTMAEPDAWLSGVPGLWR